MNSDNARNVVTSLRSFNARDNLNRYEIENERDKNSEKRPLMCSLLETRHVDGSRNASSIEWNLFEKKDFQRFSSIVTY